MSGNDYFQIYIDTIADAFRRVRKIGFKRFAILKDLMETVQGFLSKQVYGRIQPSNYLLVMILILGSKTAKVYQPIITAIQRLFSYNFISPTQQLSSSFKLVRDQHKQFLILPNQDYLNKSFKQIYIETLVNLGGGAQEGSTHIAKSLSLIWRLDQNNVPLSLLSNIYSYLLECLATCKSIQDQKMFKSVMIEMFRHALESYKQVSDRRFLNEDNSISIKSLTKKYLCYLADSVTIKIDLSQRYNIKQYEVVPKQSHLAQFRLLQSQQVNQNKLKAGKFGWCVVCRQQANYYCKLNRLPICSLQCKLLLNGQVQNLQKFINQQERSAQIYQKHIISMLQLFKSYFNHVQNKKKICFSQIFMLMASQFKKITDKLTPQLYAKLRQVVRQIISNILCQSDLLLTCMASLRKLIYLRIFPQQTQIILKHFAKKLTFFLTPSNVREQILKFIKDIISNKFIFQAFFVLDCSQNKSDAVKQLIEALKVLYTGIPIPKGITIAPIQDAVARKNSFELILLLMKFFQEADKKTNLQQCNYLWNMKRQMNKKKKKIQQFNLSQKPTKIIKKLIKQGFLTKDPNNIAQYLHFNLKRLNPTNVGQLIGDHDQIIKPIRQAFINYINFNGLPIDEALRVLLKHFTLPGQSQVVQRIIQTFGIAYYEANKNNTVFVNSDAVYSFSYLLMMLQTNLHSTKIQEKQKMERSAFSKLSKGMNGSPTAQFPAAFLEQMYESILKKPLGVHQKLKQMQIIIAFNVNPKKAQQIYYKQLQRQSKQTLGQVQICNVQIMPQSITFHIPIILQQFGAQIIEMLCFKMREIDEIDKQQMLKILQSMDSLMKMSAQLNVVIVIQKIIQKIWQQIQCSGVSKKFILMQVLLQWVSKYAENISSQWKTIIFLISKFYRNKLVRKDNNPNKIHSPISLFQNKCYLYDSYIQQLIAKTNKLTLPNLIQFFKALLTVSKDQTIQMGNPFCLQKINETFQINSGRSVEIFNKFWTQLKDYYVQLGKSKNQRIALFSSDCLKQLVTKLLKRKDMINYQKDYLKPFQQIFSSTKQFAVKQLIVGGIGYFVNNHSSSLKNGWKVILNLVNACFQEDQHEVIKEKAYNIIKKITQSNFTIFNLDQQYTDFVQILGRLARQRQQSYVNGCLIIITQIITYYHKHQNINLDKSIQAQENSQIDINFWQTVFLPLLSIIFPICGDSRVALQQAAIKTLFDILVRYGKLFKYQFWKMVLQGVLRPAFVQITYTSQSNPLKKAELQKWLTSSFRQLFKQINQLIVLYYDQFQLFLEDVFKIYQNCIINNSLKILIQISFEALNQLLQKIGPNFEEGDWQTYLSFVQSFLKKVLPNEIVSIEQWNKSRKQMQNNYEAKCFALYLFLNRIQVIYDKYPQKITQKIYLDTLKQLDPIQQFIRVFNQNIPLRQQLHRQGFYPQLKILPGLIKHHYEIVGFKLKIYYKLMEINNKYTQQYFRQVQYLFQQFQKTKQTTYIIEPQQSDYQKQRFNQNYRKILNQTIIDQLLILKKQGIRQAGRCQKILKYCLNTIGQRYFCTRCKECQICTNFKQAADDLNQQVKKLILMLFSEG